MTARNQASTSLVAKILAENDDTRHDVLTDICSESHLQTSGNHATLAATRRSITWIGLDFVNSVLKGSFTDLILDSLGWPKRILKLWPGIRPELVYDLERSRDLAHDASINLAPYPAQPLLHLVRMPSDPLVP
jgi:hypothetical protein